MMPQAVAESDAKRFDRQAVVGTSVGALLGGRRVFARARQIKIASAGELSPGE